MRHLRHELALIALLGFTTGFWGARSIAVLTNLTVAPPGWGMHVHHVLYGMGVMGLVGWLGIARKSDRFKWVFALIYGLGVGVAGDEVGNILQGFYPYPSPLSDAFFIVAVLSALIVLLIIKVLEAYRFPHAVEPSRFVLRTSSVRSRTRNEHSFISASKGTVDWGTWRGMV